MPQQHLPVDLASFGSRSLLTLCLGAFIPGSLLSCRENLGAGCPVELPAFSAQAMNGLRFFVFFLNGQPGSPPSYQLPSDPVSVLGSAACLSWAQRDGCDHRAACCAGAGGVSLPQPPAQESELNTPDAFPPSIEWTRFLFSWVDISHAQLFSR